MTRTNPMEHPTRKCLFVIQPDGKWTWTVADKRTGDIIASGEAMMYATAWHQAREHMQRDREEKENK